MADFPGAAHLAVTISDLKVSIPFYEKLFDAKPVLDQDVGPFRHVVWALPNGFLFSLHEFKKELQKPGPADEFHAGIDHFAFGVPTRADLEKCAERLDSLGIEHGKIVDADYGSGLAFRDPDNIQLEFFAPPG